MDTMFVNYDHKHKNEPRLGGMYFNIFKISALVQNHTI
jgi:hypothetical protein